MWVGAATVMRSNCGSRNTAGCRALAACTACASSARLAVAVSSGRKRGGKCSWSETKPAKCGGDPGRV
eukprot:1792824-Rhodomonas_salina.5